jgi:hypothetical protein
MRSRSNGICSCLSGCKRRRSNSRSDHAGWRLPNLCTVPLRTVDRKRKRHAPRGAPPSKSLLAHFPASTPASARSTASPSTCASGPPSPPTAANRCTGGRVRHHRPLPRADDARIIAPRATERHALRFAIPTRHTVMMGPWVPPPTSRAPAPCQITSAIPGHIALGVTPNPALSGPQTAERPPTPWMGG